MFCLVRTLGRLQPRGQSQKVHRLGELEVKIQPVNEGSSTTDRFERWMATRGQPQLTLSCGHVVHAWRYQHAGSICKYENVNITDLPEHVDWRDEGAVTPIKDQGTYCRCYAFSVVAAVEEAFKLSTGRLVRFV
ncbi:crustapain-like [Dioscorea cayenensis subsp. rotundata]|uniref:Crustapain-like n=1 Tax=Dioscorea cayennensis subsp. rotundata TaxID=55577 RepID=A0AB40AVW0_DIOCR|nr:crustapain-like [Dioscorea cayenensis subsp. rotundata]